MRSAPNTAVPGCSSILECNGMSAPSQKDYATVPTTSRGTVKAHRVVLGTFTTYPCTSEVQLSILRASFSARFVICLRGVCAMSYGCAFNTFQVSSSVPSSFIYSFTSVRSPLPQILRTFSHFCVECVCQPYSATLLLVRNSNCALRYYCFHLCFRVLKIHTPLRCPQNTSHHRKSGQVEPAP